MLFFAIRSSVECDPSKVMDLQLCAIKEHSTFQVGSLGTWKLARQIGVYVRHAMFPGGLIEQLGC